MNIIDIWAILTYVIVIALACYIFNKIIGDGQKYYRALFGFVWLAVCGFWIALFAYLVARLKMEFQW